MVYNKETNSWEALDLNAKYNLAGYNYTLRDLGGGFAMLNGAENVLDYVMEDYMVLATYVKGFENGIIDAKNSPLLAKYPQMLLDYSDVKGSGRIEIIKTSADIPDEPDVPEVPDMPDEPVDNPDTGDGSAVKVLYMVLLISGAGIFCVTVYDRKRRAESTK